MRYIWFICICATIIAGSYCWRDYYYVPDYPKGEAQDNREFKVITNHLKTFNEKNGRYPDNNEGLSALVELRRELESQQPDLPPPLGTLTDTNKSFHVNYHNYGYYMHSYNEGILNMNYNPILYENRNGLPASQFLWSPVNRDDNQNYSVKVDEGIYIYSAEGLLNPKIWRFRQMKRYGGTVIATILFIVFSYLFIKSIIINKQPQRLAIRILKWVAGIILLGISSASWKGATDLAINYTCYTMSMSSFPEVIGWVTPEQGRTQYNVLLDKYRQRGVITDATYQKIRQSLGEVDKLIQDGKIR